jgi:cytochrome c
MFHRIWVAIGIAGVIASPLSAQDADQVAAGEKVFKRCVVCHKIGEDAKNGVGPALEGVIGRTAGTGEGFDYSDPMVAAGEDGLVWDDETLSSYLTNPKAVVPGTKMSFAGLKSEDDRRAVIAYIEASGG